MKKVLMSAPIFTRSGYGDRARGLAAAILTEPEKYSLEILPQNWGNTSWTHPLDPKIKERVTYMPPNYKPDIWIQLTIPNEFQKVGTFNIGMTAGIETDLCRPEWVEGANRMDMLIGSSAHSVNVIKDSKFDKHDKRSNQPLGVLELRSDLKVHTLFEGYDEEVYKSTKTLEPSIVEAFSEIKEDFCFLFVGHWLKGPVGEDRKDVGMLVRCFVEAFKNRTPRKRPALILKTSGGNDSIMDRQNIKNKINDLTKDLENPPSIYLVHGELTELEMNSLYNHKKVKAMVSFTRGEGFNRPLLEFSTTGKPIIASNWSGHLDFLHPEYVTLLPGELTPVHEKVANDWFMKEAKWFRVNYPYAIKVLQGVFDNYEVYNKRASKQKYYVQENFTMTKMTEKFLGILDSIDIPQQINLVLPKLKKL